MGAIASGGVRVLNDEVVSDFGVSPEVIERVTAREKAEIDRREALYRQGRPAPDVSGRVVILVDDGLATGSTMRAAVAALRTQNAARIVVAVPVAAASTCRAVGNEVDEIICAETPEHFFAVGAWYDDFRQTTDEEIRRLLAGFARTAS